MVRHFNKQPAHLNSFSNSPAARLASLLITHLDPESYGSYNLESLSGHYLVHILSGIGHNAGLDSAVRCICISHSMFLKHIPGDRHCMRRLYLDAISHLQESLRRAVAEGAPKILCASMLLRLFEVISSASHPYNLALLMSVICSSYSLSLRQGLMVPHVKDGCSTHGG